VVVAEAEVGAVYFTGVAGLLEHFTVEAVAGMAAVLPAVGLPTLVMDGAATVITTLPIISVTQTLISVTLISVTQTLISVTLISVIQTLISVTQTLVATRSGLTTSTQRRISKV
jgi:hypothetical protein